LGDGISPQERIGAVTETESYATKIEIQACSGIVV